MNGHDFMDHLSESTKHLIDGLSLGVILGTLADVLPSIAAALSIVWTCVRLYETRTVQRLLGRVKDTPADSD